MQGLAIDDQVNVKIAVLAFLSDLVVDGAFCGLAQLDDLAVVVVDKSISLEEADRWFDLDAAGVTLATQVKLDDGNREELGVGAYVSRHWHFGGLWLVLLLEILEAIWWVPHSGKRHILDNQVCEFKVRLCVVRAEVKLKVD